ncbi:cysteine biosynthesis protein [Aureimonas sp. SA4125]|uniref:sulfate transporter family protein n=1 Tax=Aureimonas sp. SA4125 TaxID=2826993 RepID=UPI001CC5A4FD|nr:sulfate transporter family protein [Aureimonas sp. SA4125]BDA82517.1 cysteine biosynthesis protein [Aureimonas sp. SA4125]
MILVSASRAIADIFTAPFRAALWKSLGLTLAVLVALWFALSAGFETWLLPMLTGFFPDMPAWIDSLGSLAGWVAGLALAVLLAFLIGPISAVIASLFLDDVAEVVERESYPAVRPGEAMPFVAGLVMSVKFFGIVILGNLAALFLLLIPGINLAAFFLVNGYLLGREYFEFAALRYRPEVEAKALRRRHAGTVFLAGLVIAAFLAVPFLNLLTPLFAAAMMVHLHQRVAARDGGLPAARIGAGVIEAGLTPSAAGSASLEPARRPSAPAAPERPSS